MRFLHHYLSGRGTFEGGMKSEYDVIVAGGGPAGAMAAKTAAESGLSVLLVEKRAEIGVPVRCAEGIIKSDLEEFMQPDQNWISAEIQRGILIAPDGKKFTVNCPGVAGYTLDRRRFDKALVLRAADAGAEVQVKTRAVPLLEDGKVAGAVLYQNGEEFSVKAKVVIAADGVESQFARHAGVNTTLSLSDVMSCAEYLVAGIDIDEGANLFYFSQKNAPGGYIWVFSKGKGMANIGIGIPGNLSKDSMRAKDYLDRFMAEQYPQGKIIEIITGAVPTAPPLENAAFDGLLVAGDAAHFSDALTGGGIYQALYSGRLAGETAAAAVKAGDTSASALAAYDDAWKKSAFGRQLELHCFVRDIFRKLSDEELNSLFAPLTDITLDNVTVKATLLAILKHNPKMLLSNPSLLLK